MADFITEELNSEPARVTAVETDIIPIQPDGGGAWYKITFTTIKTWITDVVWPTIRTTFLARNNIWSGINNFNDDVTVPEATLSTSPIRKQESDLLDESAEIANSKQINENHTLRGFVKVGDTVSSPAANNTVIAIESGTILSVPGVSQGDRLKYNGASWGIISSSNTGETTHEITPIYVEGKEADFVISDLQSNVIFVKFTDGTTSIYEELNGIVNGIEKIITTNVYHEAGSYSLVDENEVPVYKVDADGNLRIPRLIQEEISGISILTNNFITCLGDSLTFGTGATDLEGYPFLLAAQTGWNVINYGIGGQGSKDIATRFGAHPVTLTADGGSIPAYGPVNITIVEGGDFLSNEIFSFNQNGYVSGIYGTIARAAGAAPQQYTFTRASAGSVLAVATEVIFTQENDKERKSLVILWLGRNDVASSDMSLDVLKQVNGVIENVEVLNRQFLILSVLNASDEPSGDPDYDKVIAVNRELEFHFGANYLDIRSILATEPNDTIPASLRFDSIHLNDAGYQIVADEVEKFITNKNWK